MGVHKHTSLCTKPRRKINAVINIDIISLKCYSRNNNMLKKQLGSLFHFSVKFILYTPSPDSIQRFPHKEAIFFSQSAILVSLFSFILSTRHAAIQGKQFWKFLCKRKQRFWQKKKNQWQKSVYSGILLSQQENIVSMVKTTRRDLRKEILR